MLKKASFQNIYVYISYVYNIYSVLRTSRNTIARLSICIYTYTVYVCIEHEPDLT